MRRISPVTVLAATAVALSAMSPLAQVQPDRWELPRLAGCTTISQKTAATRLPGNAKVLGVFDWDRDGRAEIFATWNTPLATPREFENHLLVLSEEPGGGTRVKNEFVIRDAELLQLDFYAPPNRRDTVKVIVAAMGGSYWSTEYLVESGLAKPVKLGSSVEDEFIDLNRDGVYEAVTWDRRPNELRCHFGRFGGRVNPTIFARQATGYRSVWPFSRTDGWREIMAQVGDPDRDGAPEVVALEDNGANGAGAQRVAVYKMVGKTFRLVAEGMGPWPLIGHFLLVDEAGRIELETASEETCEAWGKDPRGEGTAIVRYELRNGTLRRLN